MTGGLLLRDAEVDGRRVDVRIAGGRITAVDGDLLPAPGEVSVDAGGVALLPGLHDHHIHLLALAAAQRSMMAGPPAVRDRGELAAALRAADAGAPAGQWVRAVGYHDSVAGSLDRWKLDELLPGRPVRVQHRSGGLWALNSAAVDAAGLDGAGDVPGLERTTDGTPTGRLWRLDAWLRDRLPPDAPDLGAVGERLLRRGVTGVTDATPTDDASSLRLLADAVAEGVLPQRLVVTGGPSLDRRAVPELERGPVKLLLPDHEPPDLSALVAGIRVARAQGRPVAVHCVTAVAAVLAVAAIEEVGVAAGDRIEHGAVVPLDLAARIAALGVTVVTNPGFVAERGDRYLVEVDGDELGDLWRCRSLIDAGVAVGAGTDAPFGDPDPWAAMAAAVERRTAGGRPIGADEAVPPAVALGLFLSPLDRPGDTRRAVAVGAPADLCLLATPLDQALRDLAAVDVSATVVAGAIRRW